LVHSDIRGEPAMRPSSPAQKSPPQENLARLPKKQRVNDTGSDSSRGSSSEDESSDSETSSSSEEEVKAVQMMRPVFVPKHKRGLTKSLKDQETEEEEKIRKEKEEKELRTKQSRAMVQQVVAAAGQNLVTEGEEGITGALNTMPDDNDDGKNDEARSCWEVRELERLLENWDLEQERIQEAHELERIRKLTDEERMRDDQGLQKYRQDERQGQRFYHRGAFFMDESEWTEDDVRHKSTEYAKAATGGDKRDRRTLPKVMQVKKFGFANQSKYKGLKAEDTTDQHLDILPLSRSKKNGSSK
jgi:microfibrillar-associated protein 1